LQAWRVFSSSSSTGQAEPAPQPPQDQQATPTLPGAVAAPSEHDAAAASRAAAEAEEARQRAWDEEDDLERYGNPLTAQDMKDAEELRVPNTLEIVAGSAASGECGCIDQPDNGKWAATTTIVRKHSH
jgi:hypothetical protein